MTDLENAPVRGSSVPVLVTDSRAEAEARVAREISDLVRARPRCALGLATGRTMAGVYEELVRLHREEGLSLADVRTFNLDEYLDLHADHRASFRTQMRERLFARTDLRVENTVFPVVAGGQSLQEACDAFEARIRAAGGLELQLLGIGRNGHLAFNEPGSDPDSRTRRVELARETREDARADFAPEDVPRAALTMGLGTILEARRLRVLAFGAGKRDIVRRLLEEPESRDLPASCLRRHSDLLLLLDPESAGGTKQ